MSFSKESPTKHPSSKVFLGGRENARHLLGHILVDVRVVWALEPGKLCDPGKQRYQRNYYKALQVGPVAGQKAQHLASIRARISKIAFLKT